jgi:hypothetical protein
LVFLRYIGVLTKKLKKMKNPIQFNDDVSKKIITIRNQAVLLDSVVAEIYGVETKRVNEAIQNNPDKFPEGYVFQLKANELNDLQSKYLTAKNTESSDNQELVENFDQFLIINPLATHLEKGKHSLMLPKVFTEKGLYMLATILKSPQATKATLEIVEAFAKMRELSRNFAMLSEMEPETITPEIIGKAGSLINDLFFEHLPTTSSETSLEFNLGMVKGKKIIKSESPDIQRRFDELERMMEKMNKKLEKL